MMQSALKNLIDKESVREKLYQCRPIEVMSLMTYNQAMDIITKDPWVYNAVVFPIIRENKDESGKVKSTSMDLYVYLGEAGKLELMQASEEEYDLNGDLIPNETKNTQAEA